MTANLNPNLLCTIPFNPCPIFLCAAFGMTENCRQIVLVHELYQYLYNTYYKLINLHIL